MSSFDPLQCPACGYRGNEKTCPQCGFPIGRYQDFLSGVPVLTDETWKQELEEQIQRHRTTYHQRMIREGTIQALMQIARRLEEQGNPTGALETYRQALELAQADPSLGSLAREIEAAIRDAQRRQEPARQGTEAQRQPANQAGLGEISRDIWQNIAKLEFVEELIVPRKGKKIESKSILERNKEYTIVARGSYEYVDKRRSLKSVRTVDAKDVLLINDVKLEPIISNPERHEYVFLIIGTGKRISFRVSKTSFDPTISLLAEIWKGSVFNLIK